MFLVGPKDCGKTTYLKSLVQLNLNRKYVYKYYSLQKNSDFQLLRLDIFHQLSRKRKNVLAPELGKTYVFLIDDINL